VTLPSNLSADQADQEEVSGPDDRVRYPAADMNSGQPAPAPDTDEDVIVLAPEEDVEDDDVEDDFEDDDVETSPDGELAEPASAETSPAGELAEPASTAGAGTPDVDEQTAVAESGELAARREQPGTTEQWHDIQALFVDDPRGSVQLALQAVDGALTSFVDGLREQQAALTPDARLGDTERLRATLRSSRAFWENLVHLGDQLRSSD
jgi:hypothetical protein